jgi:hypothetical protein
MVLSHDWPMRCHSALAGLENLQCILCAGHQKSAEYLFMEVAAIALFHGREPIDEDGAVDT